MSTQDQTGQAGVRGQGAAEPTEQELRATYEAELSRITTTDMMAQAAVSLLNLGARRLAPADERDQSGAAQRDLEQARDAIDGVRALLEILMRRIPQELGPLRDALSRLQMEYAREMQATGTPAERSQGAAPAPDSGLAGSVEGEPSQGGQEPSGARPDAPGPAEASGRLWVPGR